MGYISYDKHWMIEPVLEAWGCRIEINPPHDDNGFRDTDDYTNHILFLDHDASTYTHTSIYT